LVFRYGATPLEKAVLWLILAFLISVLFILVATRFSYPRLHLVRKNDDELQTLGLSK
jgi:hypothetical protein